MVTNLTMVRAATDKSRLLAELRRLQQENDRLSAELTAEKARAQTDELTGVLRRGAWMERWQVAIELSARDDALPPVVAIIDIDNFKKINDTQGHLEGDRVIKEVASILRENLSKADAVGRFGGEEFVVLFSSRHYVTSRISAACERVRELIAKSGVTVSIGVGATIAEADANMYTAKKTGKNKVVMYDET